MKFKKFLALSLAAAMMTTGIPGVGMLDGAVNVMAAVDIGNADADAGASNNVTFKKTDGSTVNITVEYYNDASVSTATGPSVTYTGKDQKPSLKNTKVCITNDDGNVESTLAPNTDYTVAYYKVAKDGNIEVPGEKVTSIVDAGDYFITYTGKGNYSGTIYGKFTVKPIDFSAGTNNQNIYITTSKAGYTGKEISPTVSKIEYKGGSTNLVLSPNDYKIEYVNSGDGKAPGKLDIKIVGAGKNFTNEATNCNVYDEATKTYSVTTPTFTILKSLSSGDALMYSDATAKTFTIEGSSGAYSISSGFLIKKVTVDGKDETSNANVTISGNTITFATACTSGQTIAATIEGDGITFNGTAVVTYKCGNAAPTGDLSSATVDIIQNAIYTGDELKPEVIVKDGSTVLKKGVDYEVFYDSNIEMGAGNVTVVGKGNYYGIKNGTTFSIIANSLATGTVSPIASKVYTGQPQLLTAKDLTITNSNGKLISASDIDVAHIEYYLVDEDADGDLISDTDGMFGYKIVDVNKDQTIDSDDAITNPTNAGTYVVKIPLQGNYAGADKLYQTYTIKPASIATGYQFETGNNAKKDNFKTDYTGKIIKFPQADLSVTQLDAEGEKTTKTLNYGTEFTVETPKDAREVGEYNGVVKGAGNYTGEIPFTFNVVKSLGDVDIAFDVEEKKSNNKVSYIYTPYTLVKEKVGNSLLAADTDYTVSYYAYKQVATEDKADFSIGTNHYAYIGGNTSSFTLGTDYVAVVQGAGEYEGTQYKLFTVPDVSEATSISDASLTFTKDYVAIDKYSAEYNGSAVTVGAPGASNAVAVRLGNKLLSEGTDFVVAYNNNVNVSKEAEVIIIGIGDYYGTTSAKFEITQKAMSNDRIKVDTSASKSVGTYCYTGKALNASVKVADKELDELTEGVDYEISYANIIPDGNNAKKDAATGTYLEGEALNAEDITEVGTYLVVINGIGNYSGKANQLVKIEKVNLAASGDDVTIKGNDMVVTGEAITPEFTFINKADGSEFSIDASNYTVKLYADKGCTEPLDSVTEVGTYYAKLTGTKNATGKSDAIEFNVVEGKDIAGADVTALDTTENPKLLVVLDGKVLEADTDYTVEYVVGEDGKTGTAIVTGAGKYAGTVSTTYEIKKDIVALSKASIKLSKTSYGYNGKAKKPGVTVKVDGVKVDPSEYTVSYSNNKNAGTGKVTITAKDDSEVIKGSKTMTITIAKASNKVTASNVTKSYKVKTLKAKKATFKLSAKAKAGKISYKKVSSGKKIAVSKNGTVTVAKGLKKGTYKVKVKVTAASSTNYKAASKTMTVTVKVK